VVALQVIDDWDETDRCKVNLIVGQAGVAAGAGAVGATVQRMTLASDDPGVALLTTMDADTGSILTAVQLIDDAIFADDAAFTLASSKAMVGGAVRDDSLATLTAIEGDVVPLRVGSTGALWVGIEGTVTVGSHAVTNAGTFAVQAAQSGTWNITNVSGTVSLPTGAATAAKQPALGTAGTASTDVITVQGIASMTPILATLSGTNNIATVTTVTTVSAVTAITNALPAGTNAIGKLAANSGVDIGDVDVTSISAGTNLIGNVGIGVRTSGGMTIFRSIDIDETEEEIKSSAGQVYSITAFNRTAAPLYLKFYNATAANTTVGTTTPVLTFVVPANADSDGAGFVWNHSIGFAFSTAITVACTTAVADADTGAPGANDCVINVGYN
jgi:hypothetical protein